LIRHYRLDQWEQIIRRLNKWATRNIRDEWQERRFNMLKDKIEVTDWLVDLIENYPNNVSITQSDMLYRYPIAV